MTNTIDCPPSLVPQRFLFPSFDVSAAHIEALVTAEVREDADLDFKQCLYGSGESDKRALAGDIAAMRNAQGGVIVIVNVDCREASGLERLLNLFQALICVARHHDLLTQRLAFDGHPTSLRQAWASRPFTIDRWWQDCHYPRRSRESEGDRPSVVHRWGQGESQCPCRISSICGD
jgi:hypothetical protein